VTAGGLVFFATGSDRRFRAYDRDSGRDVWSIELPAASEGMPATYAIKGRQFIVVPVAAGTGLFAARFGAPFDSPRGAVAQDTPGAAAGRGGASGLAVQYIVLALKR
jgi:outer membrane protein assembly factor BamB